METYKILEVVARYKSRLESEGTPKVRLDEDRTFQSATTDELLAHAHYLCDGIKDYVWDAEKRRKTGSHLTAIQMCLSFAGWYTLGEIMNHSKPDDAGTGKT